LYACATGEDPDWSGSASGIVGRFKPLFRRPEPDFAREGGRDEELRSLSFKPAVNEGYEDVLTVVANHAEFNSNGQGLAALHECARYEGDASREYDQYEGDAFPLP